MRRLIFTSVGILALLLARQGMATGEAARYYCVELSAQAVTSPPAILLSWPFYTNATDFTVYRRNPGDTSWGSGTSVGGPVTSYTDTAVSVGGAYEYRISRVGGISGNGYVYAGIEAPPIENRGKVILLVDSTTAASLPAELARLQQDLVGDGWTVLRHDIPRTMAVTNVKAIVQADYDADPANVKSLFVFGRVPVPFSGNTSPDGHGNRAFPTDLYYAELSGTTWTDTSVSNRTWGDSANWNVPGDGKYDQNYLASAPELESGRVDMYQMPVFTNWPEQVLLQRYLNKDHAFRQVQANFALISATTNTLPYIASFEDYPPNFMLPGTDGWSSVHLDAAVVSTNPAALSALTNFTADCGLPLPATNHAQIMRIWGNVTNQFSMPTGQVVWIDTLIAFDLWDDSLTPAVEPGAQWSLCARLSGHLLLWHADLERGSNVWTELAQTIETGRWYRMTVKMDYGTPDPVHGATYYQVDLDGHTLTDAHAYTVNDGSGVTGGTWFASACATGSFSLMSFGGTGLFDDLVVTTNNPHNRLAPLGTPEWWLVAYGLTNTPAIEELDDHDRDGLSNGEEFLAGTDPLNPGSVFRIRGIGGSDGGRWPVRFDSVTSRYYALEFTTNLLVNDWWPGAYATTPEGSLQSDPLMSTGGQTTIFVEPVTLPRFYRLNVTR